MAQSAAKERVPARKGGRRTKLTPSVQRDICNALAHGIGREAAARNAGIDPSTFRRWMMSGEDQETGIYRTFRTAVHDAESSMERKVVNRLWDIIDNPDAPGHFSALRFVLERRRRMDWGPKTEVTGPDGGALQVTTTIVTELPDAEKGAAFIRDVLEQVEEE